MKDVPPLPGLVARVTGPEQVIDFANDIAERLIGGGPLLGRRALDLPKATLAAMLFAPVEDVRKTGVARLAAEVQARWDKHGDGSLAESYFDFVWRPLRGDTGEVDAVVIHGVEVTRAVLERRAAESSRAQLVDLVAGLRDALVWEADGRTLAFTFVSPSAEVLLGYPPRQWLAGPLNLRFARTHPEDRAWVERAYREEARSCRDHELVYRMLAADGRVVWMRDRVYCVRGESGAPVVLRGLMTDVTAQVNAERELGQGLLQARSERDRAEVRAGAAETMHGSLELGETVGNVARAGLAGSTDFCLVDVEGVTGTAHRDPHKAELLRGLRSPGESATEEQILHDIPDALLRNPGRAAGDAEARRTLAGRSAIVQPIVARGKHLGQMIFVASLRAHGPQDVELTRDLAGRAGLAVDNARRFTEARRDAAAREELLSVVSHDLRAPLAAIVAGAETIRILEIPGTTGERAQRVAAQIHRSSANMGRLVDDLLDATTIKSGRLELQRAPERVLLLLEEAVDGARAVSHRPLRLEIDRVDPDLAIDCDRRRVLRVLANLLTNAAKYARDGGTVRVSASGEGALVRISVRDDGQGIPAEHLPHLFERFWRAPQSVLTGHGLGLYIARGIVEAHGGTISAESAPGEGATFSFTLPKAG